MNAPNLLEGAMIKSEDARTTSIPETAGSVAAHNAEHNSTLGVYKPKKVSYPDATNGNVGGRGGDTMC